MEYLLSLHYLPCIQWFSKFFSDQVLIEQHENYSKGSYRNRAHIIGGNGLLALSVPLGKGKNQQMPIREVTISNEDRWQKLHWQSIQSAYGKSPFFEFYSDEIKPFYEKQYQYLFDFNLELTYKLMEIIGLDTNSMTFTDVYQTAPSMIDLRNGISPKTKYQKEDEFFEAVPYGQVFLERHGFLANVSVLDLLFCCGPGTISVLEESYCA